MPNVADLAAKRDPEAIRIGGILRTLRNGRGVTLQDLGERVGRTQGFLSKVELGYVALRTQLGLIAPIADAYGITADDIHREIYPDGVTPAGATLTTTSRKDGA